jgi:hypothetical protein
MLYVRQIWSVGKYMTLNLNVLRYHLYFQISKLITDEEPGVDRLPYPDEEPSVTVKSLCFPLLVHLGTSPLAVMIER